ncbi:hypothetical protein PMIN04_002728 [Paraphaeosphaeria minitans]
MRLNSGAVALTAFCALICPVSGLSKGHDGVDFGKNLYEVRLQACPIACEYAGSNPETWATYHSFEELVFCDDTILFTFDFLSTDSNPRIKSCLTTASGPRMQAGAFYGLIDNNVTEFPTPEIVAEILAPERSITSEDGSCGASLRNFTIGTQSSWSGQGNGTSEAIANAVSELGKYFRQIAGCGSSLMFARSAEHTVVGAFAGGDLAKSSVASVIEVQTDTILEHLPAQFAMQACGTITKNDTALIDTRLGVFADLTGDFQSVQTMLGTYVQGLGDCVEVLGSSEGTFHTSNRVKILTSSVTSNDTSLELSLGRRASCRDIQVVAGDGCGSLATRCGISGVSFEKYNSKTPNLCSTLKVKQWVCCTTGDLPDHTPQPSADGVCNTYTLQSGDGCWDIGDKFGITVANIEEYNKQTWGFISCDPTVLKRGQKICLSKGTPPMPAGDTGAVCGPSVVGTKRPSSWSDVAKLNPCPLNACCDIWGQCGTTDEFCIDTTVNGRPGTAKPNTNGCISNCGTKIINNNKAPAKFSRVGYFEAFNKERECLHMDITQMDLNTYTHIHFAFATISTDFKVNMTKGVKEQFDKMVKMDSKGVKKILSFGGWSFSTDHDTSPIFSQGVSDASRELFASNVVQFLVDNKLDGLDFDWEYPGATDISGSVPGTTSDGPNYLKFLQSVKAKLPISKTVSSALPASYWYLRGFPVDKMAKVVDYFIYMTYDLHGQWDHGSKDSNPGCPTGNCLRSHVNKTETNTALSMLTKAGVQANQVMVGVSSYGRSFKMVDPACTGVTCKFTGSRTQSDAEPGGCTGTSGYIADAELHSIIAADEWGGEEIVQTWYDSKSDSNMLTWDGNWVAYMNTSTKDSRIIWIKDLNFGGVSDWAVDLQSYQDPIEGDTSGGELVEALSMECDGDYDDLDAVVEDKANIQPHCTSEHLLVAMDGLLNDTLKKYDDVKNDYNGKFKYYSEYINDLINPKLEDWMDNSEKDDSTKKGLGNRFFNCRYQRKGDKASRYDGACPVPSGVMAGTGGIYDPDISFTIEYTLEDKYDFEKALVSEAGIQPGWIKWEDWDGYDRCEAGTGGGGSGPDARKFQADNSTQDNSTNIMGIPCIPVTHMHKNFPRKADSINITDPKTVMEKALPTIDGLRDQIKGAVLAITLGMYNSSLDDSDAVIALSTPVQMLAQAVQQMDDVKEIGSEIAAAKKKETILLIVSLVLMIVPFVAEVGFEVAGLTALARFAFIAGEVANGANSIVEIIDNPESAPFAVMGILSGAAAGKGGRLEDTMADAAKARKKLPDAGAMGKRFKEIDDKVQSVLSPKCNL